MVELYKFRYDRGAALTDSCNLLYDTIENFAHQPELEEWLQRLARIFVLPIEVIRHDLKSYLELSFHYQQNCFSAKLKWRQRWLRICRYLIFLLICLAYSKEYKKEKQAEVSLLVDGVENQIEARRFLQLIKLFNHNALVIATQKLAPTEIKYLFRPRFKWYCRARVIAILLSELKVGWRVCWRASNSTGVDFFQITKHLINQYLYYYSIFRFWRAKFCIQERHYQTSAIKDALFHHFGGRCSASLQKNVHQLGKNGFYYHVDTLFALGKNSATRALAYGAQIKNVVPVGSLFMEHYWLQQKPPPAPAANYDLVFMGINVSVARYFMDAYEKFNSDYYQSFEWLVQFAKENPSLKIGVKHHSNNISDPIEQTILQGSRVERINQQLNSYAVGFQARCIATFGSTIGFEFLGHGGLVVFLDPGGRCALLPALGQTPIDEIRAISYVDFRSKVQAILANKFSIKQLNPGDYCLPSKQVSLNIYCYFRNYGERC